MRLVVVSGLSGAGKSVALHMLEDVGFYCIDNMPAALLRPFISHAVRSGNEQYQRTAVGLDARNTPEEIASLPALIGELKRSGIRCEVLFLQAADEELLKRFADTKRRHPMGGDGKDLRDSIAVERRMLDPIAQGADLIIDTSRMGVHELRDVVSRRIERRAAARLSILFESFGYKHGLPGDADFVFDARTLPNPYWEANLRSYSGRDPQVAAWLEQQPGVSKLIDDIESFVEARIPEHTASNRRYLTVAVGCTGGQHRSVYIVERLAERFARRHDQVATRHNELA